MCLDTLMQSIAITRLKMTGFELELFEFLWIITLSYIQAPWRKFQKNSLMLRKEKTRCEAIFKDFNKKYQAYGLNIDFHNSLELPHPHWYL